MAKKFNKSLLNEELKRFRLLSEYSFYTEEPNKDDDLILGAKLGEADEETPEELPADAPEEEAPEAAAPETEAPEGETPAEEAPEGEAPEEEAPEGEEEVATDEMPGEETPEEEPAPAEDEVEVDVTQLVKGSKEATQAAMDANQKTSELLTKFSDLEQRVANMTKIANKIDTLEKEIVKRNPTPVEKLEMRSMDSFPYNIKLSDYWKDVEGYDITQQDKKPEYVLTKDEVDTGYTDASIKQSFNVPNEFEEEDI